MVKDVNSKLRHVDANYFGKRKPLTAVWPIPAKCNLDDVHFNFMEYRNHWDEKGKREPIYPLEDWSEKITIQDGFELAELDKQARKVFADVNPCKYKNLKLKISYDEVLGDIELELVNGAGQRMAYYSKKATLVTFRKSDVHDSVFSAGDTVIEVIDGDPVETDFISYHNLDDLRVAITGIETVEKNGVVSDETILYYRLLTDTPRNIKKLVRSALNKLPSNAISDLSDSEVNEVLDNRGKKVLPKYINGLRFIGGGEPYLKLGELTNAFSVDAKNEARLAKVIFGERRDLSKTIFYEEIYDSVNESYGLYGSLSDSQKKAENKRLRDDMGRLNHRIGSMLGLGEKKALVSVEDGIAVNHHLLKPKN
ncbi:hypothetical protein IKF03_03350 [Candidatus Saccharibacteria bacterium]|nr:hypothetical protein [Candidatus Saccharibacteria bacterium]